MNLFASFNSETLRIKLRLSSTRIDLLKSKKTAEIKRHTMEVANLLRDGQQEELARIRTEHIVREDYNIEVLGILGLLCALLQERTKLLEVSPKIPFDMKESVVTLIYAADRVQDLPELRDIKHQLLLKYKKEILSYMDTESKLRENINERVYDKLSMKPPNAFVVTGYMQTISEANGVDWAPSDPASSLRFDAPPKAPSGNTVMSGGGSGITSPYMVTDGNLSLRPSPGVVAPLFPSSGGGRSGGGGGGSPDVVPSLFGGAAGATTSNPAAFASSTGDVKLGPKTVQVAAISKGNKKKDDDFVVLKDDNADLPPLPPAGYAPASNATAVPDFDELTRRFQALKGNN